MTSPAPGPELRPDYEGGSIANLMASLVVSRGGRSPYAHLRGLGAASLEARTNVVLMVIDGLGHRYLRERHPDSSLASHLRGTMTSVFPTTTASAITTFLTGLAPQQHGLTGWFTYFAELDAVIAVLPFEDRRSGRSLQELGLEVNSLYGTVPVFDQLRCECHVVTPRHIARSPFNLAHSGSARIRPYAGVEQFFGAVRNALADGPGRKYVYAYWPEIDRLGHETGAHSDVTARSFEQLDAGFAALLDDIAGSDTTVIATADHGMIDTAPEAVVDVADHPEMAEALSQPLCGEPRAAFCYVRPKRHAAFERYVGEALAEAVQLIPAREAVAAGLFGPGEPHPQLAGRVGDYLLLMKHHYVVRDTLPGENRSGHVGVHGGLTADELHVPLIVAEAA